MKLLQALVRTTPFYPPPHYKSLQPNRKQDEQYWKKVAVKFLKQKYNTDITRHRFSIEIYIEGLLYELYFIALIL